MEDTVYCSVCDLQANLICYCSSLPLNFCNSCFTKHIQLKPQLLHLPNTIELHLNSSKRAPEIEMCFCGTSSKKSCRFCRFSFENKRRRIKEFNDFNEDELAFTKERIYNEMQKNILKLNSLKENIQNARTLILTRIDEIVAANMQKIAVIESTITQITEGLDSATGFDFFDETIYAHWLIKDFLCSPRLGNKFDLDLFQSEIDLSPVFTSLDTFCKIILNDLPSPSISYFKPKTNVCYTYNINSQTVSKTQIHSTEPFRTGAAFCQIADQKYFYCGGEGRGISNQACLIYISNTSIFMLPSMNCPRSYHAIVYYEQNIYVFGGTCSSGRLKSCEKYDFERSTWLNLPNMLVARSHFTATTFKKKIYIAGGCGSNTIEHFDPFSQIFTKLAVMLPFPSYWTMIGAFNDEIIVFQGNTVMKINDNNNSRSLIENSGGWWSEIPLYKFRQEVFFFKKSLIMSYNPVTNTAKELASMG